MNIRTKSALVLSSVALGATGILSAAPATAAPASTHTPVQAAAGSGDVEAAASGSANRVLWTSNRAGSIKIKWTWHSSADGKTYYGSFAGKFYDHKIDGKYVLLQAKWQGKGWTTIRTAANGESFRGDYSKLKNLNFRACLQGGNCGAAAW
ncbi:hypothetical protein AB0L56_09415 [Streptomyces sp. NPDC052079]|uniref:hypothetical protein n=1 Tax=Streptomyces sp. NPDC052079 TaxID=3155526 RepID=UPI003418C426